MAEAATVTPIRPGVVIVDEEGQSLFERGRELLLTPVRKVRGWFRRAWSWVKGSPATQWVRNTVKRGVSAGRRLAGRLGRAGTVAAAVTVVTSKTGQAWIAAAGRTVLQGTGKVLNAIATGLSRALGWIPGPTRWLGARVADAQRWANERVVKVKTWTGWKSIHDRIRHDSKPVRYIQMFARAIFTGRVLRIFIGGLPAPVKFLAGVAAALVTSPKWARDEAKARWQEAKDRVEARRKAREAQNGAVLIDTTASVNGTATKVNTPEGVAAEAAAAAADQEAARQREISEAEQRKAVLESSLSTVVDNAIDFYTRPQEYKGPSAMENLKRALQKAVTPGYHPVLPSQQVHKAARAFAEDVAVRFHSVEGTGQPEDDDNNPWINLAHPELPKLLREIAQRYFEEFDTPPPARKARAATAGRR